MSCFNCFAGRNYAGYLFAGNRWNDALAIQVADLHDGKVQWTKYTD